MRRFSFSCKPARFAQAGILLTGVAIGALSLGGKIVATIAAAAAALSIATAITLISRRENDR